MGAGVFHGRVRDGIGCFNAAIGTRPPNRNLGLGGEGIGWVLSVWAKWGLVLRAVSVDEPRTAKVVD